MAAVEEEERAVEALAEEEVGRGVHTASLSEETTELVLTEQTLVQGQVSETEEEEEALAEVARTTNDSAPLSSSANKAVGAGDAAEDEGVRDAAPSVVVVVGVEEEEEEGDPLLDSLSLSILPSTAAHASSPGHGHSQHHHAGQHGGHLAHRPHGHGQKGHKGGR